MPKGLLKYSTSIKLSPSPRNNSIITTKAEVRELPISRYIYLPVLYWCRANLSTICTRSRGEWWPKWPNSHLVFPVCSPTEPDISFLDLSKKPHHPKTLIVAELLFLIIWRGKCDWYLGLIVFSPPLPITFFSSLFLTLSPTQASVGLVYARDNLEVIHLLTHFPSLL